MNENAKRKLIEVQVRLQSLASDLREIGHHLQAWDVECALIALEELIGEPPATTGNWALLVVVTPPLLPAEVTCAPYTFIG